MLKRIMFPKYTRSSFLFGLTGVLAAAVTNSEPLADPAYLLNSEQGTGACEKVLNELDDSIESKYPFLKKDVNDNWPTDPAKIRVVCPAPVISALEILEYSELLAALNACINKLPKEIGASGDNASGVAEQRRAKKSKLMPKDGAFQINRITEFRRKMENRVKFLNMMHCAPWP